MAIKLLTPIESMNPIYLGPTDDEIYDRILKEHNGSTYAEVKEDGYRIQVHKKGNVVKGFTRSMKEVYLDLFPELSSSLSRLPNCILDCELIGRGEVGHQGFKSVKKRFRSRIQESKKQDYLESGIIDKYPLSLKIFDVLKWERSSLMNKALEERRKYTENIDEKNIKPSELREIFDANELRNWFEKLTDNGYEGLVCKNPSSIYSPGARGNDWIKLKRSETLDLVVLGVYNDPINGNGDIGHILCGTYNEDTRMYETLAKVNAKRDGINKELERLLKRKRRKTMPSGLLLNEKMFKDDDKVPDSYLTPALSVVVEVAAMNLNHGKNWHSCCLNGSETAYSLRIGWLKGIRHDKDGRYVTASSDVERMYKMQEGRCYG